MGARELFPLYCDRGSVVSLFISQPEIWGGYSLFCICNMSLLSRYHITSGYFSNETEANQKQNEITSLNMFY